MTSLKNINLSQSKKYQGNIENFVGYTAMPTGIIKELLVHGKDHTTKAIIPLATTEGALVASYSRGCKVISVAGGATSICVDQGVQRVPTFVFDRLSDAYTFVRWIETVVHEFDAIVATRTNHGKMKSCRPIIEGNTVNIVFTYTTGDAAGQNMVTFCTDEVCKYLLDRSPISPVRWYIEGNMSGDKKPTSQHLSGVRGRKVVADVVIPRNLVRRYLKTTPEAMANFWKQAIVNQVMSNATGASGHIANGLTAVFIATGQDAACVSEASVGISRFDVTEYGALYASITLPSLIVGTVGGGTKMSYAQANLEMMGCTGIGSADKYAEIIGAMALGGEISIAAAMAANHFTSAHERLGR